MEQIDRSRALELVRQADTLSWEAIRNLQDERLRELISYAREHSPYLRKKYEALGENYSLEDIPVSTRAEMVDNFESWVCDAKITRAGLEEYLSDRDNILKPYLGEYAIATTSGTTAEPLRIVRDARHQAVHGALLYNRYLHGSLLKDVENLDDPDLKCCAIIPNTGFHSSYLSFLRTRKAYEERGKADRTMLIPLTMPIFEMAEKLNEFQPEMIGCYPSIIYLLAHEQNEGRLNIHPRYIGCSAEKLTDANRLFISEVFSCPVNNNYCSTEGGEVAMLCSHGHMHINSDWILVEPVDSNGNPVAQGEQSEGILITNLANLVQPVIRYRMSDRVVIYDKQCGCGLSMPYLDISGRMEDTLSFEAGGKTINISGLVFYASAIDTPGCEQAQIIQRAPHAVELRITTLSSYDREPVKEKVRAVIEEVLKSNGLPFVTVTMSDGPIILTKGGKVRLAYRDF